MDFIRNRIGYGDTEAEQVVSFSMIRDCKSRNDFTRRHTGIVGAITDINDPLAL
ncbi:hypothetical protein [Candidatus Weimeria sp. HCP3S3_B5]|uniref:hypothetical protein n=1 Tax=Candidatus Weimeria sp. HCP3S3_B5 TaxID=3438871 RepID=UPI003F8C17A6